MSTAPIQLYAELLTNIRHVSISVTLATPVDSTTVAELLPLQDAAPGHARLRVRHNGDAREMTLPGRVAMEARPVRLPVPHAKAAGDVLPRYLTWRLPVAADDGMRAARGGGGGGGGGGGSSSSDDDELAPWSAPDLRPRSKIVCRACDAVTVPADRVTAWKDLPSDNWAEMMEFWHCHKPEHNGHGKDEKDEKATEDALAGRGYGANSVIRAEAGVGFVDLITLLFAKVDCPGVVFSEPASATATATATATPPRGLGVSCASCGAQLGYFNLRTQSVNLFKWQVGCASVSGSAPSVADCVAATLVATIARTGSSKSVILPIHEAPAGEGEGEGEARNKVLQVWVLNSSICFASTALPSKPPGGPQPPRRAIKLLYKYIDRSAAEDLAAKLTSDVQEINLPSETIEAVAEHLEASTALLPGNERVFKEWKIGLVVRWERAPACKRG